MEKVLLITGASSEVGMNLIEKVYRDYQTIYVHYVHMNDRLKGVLERIKDKVNIVELQADFTDYSSVNDMIETIRNSDIIPNNIVHLTAPKAYNKQFNKDCWDNYQIKIDIMIRSFFEIAKAFMGTMSKNRYGRIVVLLSSYTDGIPAKYQSSYVTVKYALLGMMKSLSVDYADKGITVNGVSPSMMETKFLSDIPELIIEQNASNSPLGRNIKVDEVIPVIEYMLSDAGAAITGQNVVISGGI